MPSRSDVIGGFTTFLTVAYIVIVNPSIFWQPRALASRFGSANSDGVAVYFDDRANGTLRKTPVCRRAGEGAQCVFYLYARTWQRNSMANSSRYGFPEKLCLF
jgi:hypothetical protein